MCLICGPDGHVLALTLFPGTGADALAMIVLGTERSCVARGPAFSSGQPSPTPWARRKGHAAQPDREVLILAHIPLVRYVAGRMLPSLHASVEYQYLVSYGMFGLIDAIEKYRLDAGTKFSTFAHYRIRGAITDEMREQAWEPRSVRARSRLVVQGKADLELKLGRAATEAELAAQVDMTVMELRKVSTDVRSSRMSSLSAPLGESDGDGTIGDMLVSTADTTDLNPQVSEAAAMVSVALELLPENDRVLMAMVYVKGMALKDIAKLLEVTESWVRVLLSPVTRRALGGVAP